MKKRNLKSLLLNKTKISLLTMKSLNGGMEQETSTCGYTKEDCKSQKPHGTCDTKADCEEPTPITEYCGSNNNGIY